MKTITIYFIILLGCFSLNVNAQITFIEFEQEQCGLITEHGFTFENIPLMCGSHSSGYKIYLNGAQVFEKCIEFGGCSILEIMFINETTGFLVETNPNGHSVYKTINSGTSWSYFGGGAPTFLGFYLVNENTAYLLTTWDNPLNLYINRASDIRNRVISDSEIMNDTLINDTIFGIGFCDYDTLGFKIKNANDTIHYQILFNVELVSINNITYDNQIRIYPNPADDFIEFSQNFRLCDECRIKVFDTNGKLIESFNYTNKRIYIGDLKAGIYFIEVSDRDKRRIGKLIKQ